MDTLNALAHGFTIALTFENLGLALIGCFLGTIIGALPGLGPSNGVAILIPLAFTLGLPATPALILLTSVYYGANVWRPDFFDPAQHSGRRAGIDDDA
jgi:putative tricarboxylic transport membrane protein